MSKADFSTVVGIKAEIASIAKAGKTLDGRIQRCAVASFEHMLAHRDHTLLVDLYQALSKGMRRASMASWIMQFTQLTANTDPATKAEKPAKEVKEKAPSTKSKVVPVVTAAIAAGTARKDTLAKLQADFGISAACANTYYQNVKSGNWK